MTSNNSDNSTNIELQFPDFASMNSNNFHEFSRSGICGVSKVHFLIYLFTFIVSILLTIPYGCDRDNVLFTIVMSIGASGVGAALLGYFIEKASTQNEENKAIKEYNTAVITIYYDLWLLFANQSYEFMKNIDKTNGQDLFVNQRRDKFLMQINIVAPKIDSFIVSCSEMHDDNTIEYFQLLKSQLVEFSSRLQNTLNTEDLIVVIEGIRVWLRKYFEINKVEKLFVKR